MCFGSVWANLLSFKLRKNFLKYSYELIIIAQAGATFAILGNRPVENKTRIKYHHTHILREREREKMFYLTTHSTHFIYGYISSDIWLRTILRHILRERERNVLFNDALNTFYLRLYGVRHMVKDHSKTHFKRERERNVLFNDALNTFHLRLYGIRHMVKDHSDSEKGNPLPPYRLLLSINSKGSFICTIPQTG